MPLTRLANAVIDAVAERPRPVADEIAKYLGSDLVFYRAEGPEGLVARQTEIWDPVLAFARDALGARFVQVAGVMFAAAAAAGDRGSACAYSGRCLAARRRVVDHHLDRLGPAGAGACHGALDAEAAWDAAHLDEDWQMAQWGRDELALARRDFRRADFDAATTVLKLAR